MNAFVPQYYTKLVCAAQVGVWGVRRSAETLCDCVKRDGPSECVCGIDCDGRDSDDSGMGTAV